MINNIINDEILYIISKNNKNKICKIITFKNIIILCLIINFFFFGAFFYFSEKTNRIYYDQYESDIFDDIRTKLEKLNCSLMTTKQRMFLNGIIRKYKPKKILEVGVFWGGSSAIILNGIKDIKNSHLFSLDIKNYYWIGQCVNQYFPKLMNKWSLFKGDIIAKYIEKIGNKIDLAFLDTYHFEPGEILDFLMVLPFLKERAIVIIHDIDHQITNSYGRDKREEWAPYIIFNLIRGDKFFPSGNGVLNKNIGGVKLERNQKRFIHDYCRALGGQWQYFPSEENIRTITEFFRKYYDNECQTILNETIEFNRQFLKDNPKEDYYAKLRRKKLLISQQVNTSFTSH